MDIVGQVIDSATKEPIVGAVVYVSDKNAKPIGNNSTATDVNGRYTLKNVNANNIIASRAVTYPPSAIPVSKAITMPNGFKALLIKLTQGKEGTLEEVLIKPKDEKTKITTSGSVITDAKTTAKSEEKVKEPMKLWVKIALGVGAVTVLGIIIFLATKNDKKGKK
jgi:hypothetical protein